MIRSAHRGKISLSLSVVPIPAFFYHNETIFTFSKVISLSGDGRENPLLTRFPWTLRGRLSAWEHAQADRGGMRVKLHRVTREILFVAIDRRDGSI